MAKYAYHRTDGNAADLERAAKQLGLTVVKLGRPVDWLILGHQLAVACEVKTVKGKLRPDQIAFQKAAGASCWVLRTVDDVIALESEMRSMASWLAHFGWPNEEIAAEVDSQ